MQNNKFNSLNLDLDFILNSSPGFIYWKDTNSRYLGCNQNLANISGLKSPQDIIGKTDSDFEWGEGFANKFVEDDQEIIKTGKTQISEYVMPIKNTEGHNIVVRTEKKPLLDKNKNIIGILANAIDITKEKEAEQLKLENEKQKALNQEQDKFNKIVGQMVHDIQSPLSSLSSILNETSSGIPENKRNILRTALTSISDITNHMLRKYSNNPDAEDEPKQPVLVSEMILQAISEKRFEYKDKKVQFEHIFRENTEFSFIKIEPSAFKRMLSNLINNAVDALGDKPNRKVELLLSADNEEVTICIEDNGKGMLKDTIKKIKMNIRFSQDKNNGYGLGLTQVYDTLNHNDGTLGIVSDIGSGTTMVIKFPRISMPTWIANKINIVKGDTVVILDDEKSIHYAWDDKFKDVIEEIHEVKIKHFENGKEVIDFINSLDENKRSKIYLLTDYELLEQEVNGIDVIKQTGVKRTLLVTSHYANPQVRDLAIDAQVKLLPKNLAFAVKIKVDKKLKSASRKVDMVWLDDEIAMVEKFVKMKYRHLKIDTYSDPISFLEDVHQYPQNTRIILDLYYYSLNINSSLNGFKVAKILHEKGYTNLILTTGEQPNQKIPGYLRVVLKKDLDKLFLLDKI